MNDTALKLMLKRFGFQVEEVEMIKSVHRYQDTFRLSEILPMWNTFKQTKNYSNLNERIAGRGMQLFEAYWNLLLEIQLKPDDFMSVAYAISYRAQEKIRMSHGTGVVCDRRLWKNIPQEHFQVIEESVSRHFRNLDK